MLLDVQGHDPAAGPRPAQVARVGAGQSALAGVLGPQLGFLNVGVQRVGQGQLPLVPHPRAGHISARQPHGLIGPPVTELERGRNHRRRRRFGIEPVRVPQVHQVEVRREPVRDRLLQLGRRRYAQRPGQYGSHVIQQHDADAHPRPARPASRSWHRRDRPKPCLRINSIPSQVPYRLHAGARCDPRFRPTPRLTPHCRAPPLNLDDWS